MSFDLRLKIGHIDVAAKHNIIINKIQIIFLMSNTSQNSVTRLVDSFARAIPASLGLDQPRQELSFDTRQTPADYGPLFFGAANLTAGPTDMLLGRQAYYQDQDVEAMQAYKEQALAADDNRMLIAVALNKMLQPVAQLIASSGVKHGNFHMPNNYI